MKYKEGAEEKLREIILLSALGHLKNFIVLADGGETIKEFKEALKKENLPLEPETMTEMSIGVATMYACQNTIELREDFEIEDLIEFEPGENKETTGYKDVVHTMMVTLMGRLAVDFIKNGGLSSPQITEFVREGIATQGLKSHLTKGDVDVLMRTVFKLLTLLERFLRDTGQLFYDELD